MIIMEDFFEDLDFERYKKKYDEQIQKGREAVKSLGINYTKFKELVLMGVKEEAPEDWIVILYNDYLFDCGRFIAAYTPVDWLASYAADSWSVEKFETTIKPLKDLAMKNKSIDLNKLK